MVLFLGKLFAALAAKKSPFATFIHQNDAYDAPGAKGGWIAGFMFAEKPHAFSKYFELKLWKHYLGEAMYGIKSFTGPFEFFIVTEGRLTLELFWLNRLGELECYEKRIMEAGEGVFLINSPWKRVSLPEGTTIARGVDIRAPSRKGLNKVWEGAVAGEPNYRSA